MLLSANLVLPFEHILEAVYFLVFYSRKSPAPPNKGGAGLVERLVGKMASTVLIKSRLQCMVKVVD